MGFASGLVISGSDFGSDYLRGPRVSICYAV